LINDDAKKVMQKIYTKSKYVAKGKDEKNTLNITATLISGANRKDAKKTCSIIALQLLQIYEGQMGLFMWNLTQLTSQVNSSVVLGMKNKVGIK
jgi:hypothetical protein